MLYAILRIAQTRRVLLLFLQVTDLRIHTPYEHGTAALAVLRRRC
jgi:hypothetical protein